MDQQYNQSIMLFFKNMTFLKYHIFPIFIKIFIISSVFRIFLNWEILTLLTRVTKRNLTKFQNYTKILLLIQHQQYQYFNVKYIDALIHEKKLTFQTVKQVFSEIKTLSKKDFLKSIFFQKIIRKSFDFLITIVIETRKST